MSLLVPDVGEQRMIGIFLNATTGVENVVLRLFKNNITPASSMTLADYTEATFGGYASVTCTSGSWSIVSGAPTSATQSSATTFTCTAATSEAIYGYYLSQASASTLMWSERFSDGPYTVTSSGDKIIITAKLTISTT